MTHPDPESLRWHLAQEVKDREWDRRKAKADLYELEERARPRPSEARIAEARYQVDLADYHWRQAKRFFSSLNYLFDFGAKQFAPGRDEDDLIPFAEAWPERGVFVEGIANPHLRPIEGKPDRPQPPEPVPEPEPAPERPSVAVQSDRSAVTGQEPATMPSQALAMYEDSAGGDDQGREHDPDDGVRVIWPSEPPATKELEVASPATPSEPGKGSHDRPVAPAAIEMPPANDASAMPPVGVETADGGHRVREMPDLVRPSSPVGYKCPPEHGKFRKGDGRHRPGRPPGSKNVATYVREAATRLIKTLDERTGRVHKMPQLQAIVEQTFGDAMEGKEKARQQVLQLAERHLEGEKEAPGPAPLSEADRMVLQSFAAMMKFIEDSDDASGRKDER